MTKQSALVITFTLACVALGFVFFGWVSAW